MASTTSSSTGIQSENIPQWKKDLIQRRRQQSKVLASNGASVKLCTAVIGSAGGAESFDNGLTSVLSGQHECVVVGGGGGAAGCKSAQRTSGAAAAIDSHCVGVFAPHQQLFHSAVTSAADGGSSNHQNQQQQQQHHHHRQRHTVAGNMRLDTDALCSDADYDLNAVSDKMVDNKSESRDIAGKLKSSKSADMELSKFANDGTASEDGESDSSEELQYGPGIVNRLKSKYLNLTLREMNKSRPSVQNFRRAASLEDLLDCDDDVTAEKSQRKYTKRNAVPGVLAKSERYRNADRGNDSMKRARSVETLLRYNSVSDDFTPHIVPSRFTAGVAKKHHEPNDHIILIDRTSVKIESKLGDPDRPKPLNKPRRVKLVVDETERPPPDLVKTTMRIFEGSTKKLKPKGEVAAKVATFKTINDTFKAQNQKKIVIPKPPLQPKPFANGVSNKLPPSSPKKSFTVPAVPTVERLEHPDSNFHNEGVITEPIVQSVSSVVSKFQQIEKLRSPSASPEPLCKFKFSPAASPEPPFLAKSKIKSPPSTPEPRPRIISPGKSSSPLSPKKDIIQDQNNFANSSVASSELEISKPVSDPSRAGAETSGEQRMEIPRPVSPVESLGERRDEREEGEEAVDGGKSISKTALENIAKAGTTMQFSFNDRPESSCGKNYLPGCARRSVNEAPFNKTDDTQDGTAIPGVVVRTPPPVPDRSKAVEIPVTKSEDKVEPTANGEATEGKDGAGVVAEKTVNRVQDVARSYQGDGKPIGAISSLGLLKSNVATSTTSTTSYPQCNEAKMIKTQKTESSSPPQKQIGIIRPLVSTKTQVPQQNLSNREIEKNLINRAKSIEQPTKVVVSLKSAEEIQPVKKTNSNSGGGGVGGNGGNGGNGGGGGLWDTKPWNDQNNTMVFNFINREEVPDYIENDGLRVKRKRVKPKAGEGGIIVLDATLDASTTDEAEWEMTGGPPSPCNVSFLNDNILINGRSNLSKQPRNHKHRIQFDDTATRTFEYPSEASMLVGESSKIASDSSIDRSDSTRDAVDNRPPSVSPTPGVPSVLGGGGLASYTPSKVDLASEGFELGVTRASPSSTASRVEQPESLGEVDYLKPAQDAGAWGSETTADLLF
ncbi:uncharacterized protein LOC124301353 [Neodiprion virginianus]|uniref:uncharacterized protein LOC124301353 n=1 Tax=Neodiprion virginianus TaxID=2961670 RepID=UPI001EE761B9|nr:uncharacterized protein LOC124301353 [Neodiprion virginianus]